MITKNELRKIATEKRKELNIEKISKKIVEKIKNSEFYLNSKNVMIFYPLKNEINLLELTQDQNKNFYLPRINGNKLEACFYDKSGELKTSSFKTKEPTTEPIEPKILDVIFIPALTVDKKLYRLGYGKGFYDRFLNANKLKATKIVPIASELIVDSLPADNFDQKVDLIIDEL